MAGKEECHAQTPMCSVIDKYHVSTRRCSHGCNHLVRYDHKYVLTYLGR